MQKAKALCKSPLQKPLQPSTSKAMSCFFASGIDRIPLLSLLFSSDRICICCLCCGSWIPQIHSISQLQYATIKNMPSEFQWQFSTSPCMLENREHAIWIASGFASCPIDFWEGLTLLPGWLGLLVEERYQLPRMPPPFEKNPKHFQ